MFLKTQKMNKKMNVFCKIILPLLCIISCSKRKEADNTMVLEKNHTFFLWNNDSLGCKHERTIEMGEELYNTFKKSNKNDSILLKEYLGPAFGTTFLVDNCIYIIIFTAMWKTEWNGLSAEIYRKALYNDVVKPFVGKLLP